MNKYKILVLTIALWSISSTASAATMSLSPATGTYAPGSTFTVDVLLNTTGAAIDGLDIRYLHFNPSLLQVVDSNSSQSGIQVSAGTLIPMTLTNTVDNTSGLITFSQIVNAGQHYTGSGTLLTISFKVIASGSATLTFDAGSGKTTDTNVASAGQDVLTTASGGTFTLSGNVTPQVTIPAQVQPQIPAVANDPNATVTLSRTIYIGSSGSDVTDLQNFLISLGYLPAGNNSGYFGALTQSAVRAYQCAKGISCSGDEGSTGYGLVGAKTRTLMSGGGSTTVVTPTPSTPTTSKLKLTRTMYVGSKGTDVTALQNFLITKGYLSAGNNTGYFGNLTRLGVKQYQCAKGLVCTGNESSTGYGMVGMKTRALLNAE